MDIYETDVLIVGCGIAGLYASLHIDPRLRVLFVTKEGADTSNSWLAQGGIAAAITVEDDPQQHFLDTLEAGAGVCDESAVRVLVNEGPREIAALRQMAVPFDLKPDGTLSVTREGGHHRDRVVHAGGDATGRETVKTLSPLAQTRPNTAFWEHSFFLDLIVSDGRVRGAYVYTEGKTRAALARCVVLCTGGAGRIYGRSTNPSVATGDGIAAARRAGAALKNMEFVQFHPTGLHEQGAPEGRAFLITEALRGEGALLRNTKGERFMAGTHPLDELAPRDIVSRAIVRELNQSGEEFVCLDITGRGRDFLKARFPTVYTECERRGLHIERDFIPVSPVQHYMVGGIATGLWGECTLPGLYSVGESACTGVHGANRLASNSMLECLVFGRRCAEHINAGTPERVPFSPPPVPSPREGDAVRAAAARREIRAVCDRDAGIIRTAAGMARGIAEMRGITESLDATPSADRETCETRNMAHTALCVLEGALSRPESAGTHFVERGAQ
ncbi:MAG: L-aspartate oxidase [Oscillospiraceae bacterium]|nr:L-aspartate oxidase [Oscillospiraceae bacterium]